MDNFLLKHYVIGVYLFCVLLYFFGGILPPLLIAKEFGYDDFLRFYIPRYPHLTFYPPFYFAGAVFFFGRGLLILKDDIPRIKRLILCLGLVLIFVSGLAYFEQRQNFMMLFEFKKTTQEENIKIKLKEILNLKDEGVGKDKGPTTGQILNKFINGKINMDFPISLNPRYKCFPCKEDGSTNEKCSLSIEDFPVQCKMRELFAYNSWEKKESKFSKTRLGYIGTVFSMSFVMLSLFIVAGIYPASEPNRRYQIINEAIGSAVFLVLWIPFRIYFNWATKDPLFSIKFYFLPPEAAVLATLGCFAAFVSWMLSENQLGKTKKIIGIFSGLGIPSLIYLWPELIDRAFNLTDPQPFYTFIWIGLPVFFVFVLLIKPHNGQVG